jgi:hypothetical protein
VIATIASVMDFKRSQRGYFRAIGTFGAHFLPLLAMTCAFALVSVGIIKLVNRMLRRHHATSYAQ